LPEGKTTKTSPEKKVREWITRKEKQTLNNVSKKNMKEVNAEKWTERGKQTLMTCFQRDAW
jgi:hypothetical protein